MCLCQLKVPVTAVFFLLEKICIKTVTFSKFEKGFKIDIYMKYIIFLLRVKYLAHYIQM